MPTREDLLPYYREDLMDKVSRVRETILDITRFGIDPIRDVSQEDYELIRLAVINSIKGTAIALEESSRQKWVESVFLKPAKERGILSYEDKSGEGKCDFIGIMNDSGKFGLEVKGGEGNSVTLLHRPEGSDSFIVWSHLDVMSNTPAENMNAVLGRVVKQMINRDEKMQKVDYLVFYDEWYTNGVKRFIDNSILPDVVVFPSAIPTIAEPEPTCPNLGQSHFLKCLYDTISPGVGLDSPFVKRHIWQCYISLAGKGSSWSRLMTTRNWAYPDITLARSRTTKASVKPVDRLPQ